VADILLYPPVFFKHYFVPNGDKLLLLSGAAHSFRLSEPFKPEPCFAPESAFAEDRFSR